MAKSLELIRVKITELEAKLADLRIAERELVALEPARVRKSTTPRVAKPKAMRPARPTISAAIADVLNAHGALPAAEIADQIQAGGRETGKRSISHSLQALKKQGRVRIRSGKWTLVKARTKAASTQ